MCMAYSGNCVISNYTQGRDSNRGGCAHSCRFEYSLDFSNISNIENQKSFFMSSKDLNGLRVLEEYIRCGIDSVKVEGRMKSHHYAGTVTKVYKQALLHYQETGNFLSKDLLNWSKELNKVSHREYSEANLITEAGEETIYNERENEENEYVIACVVVESVKNEFLLVEVRSHFSPKEILEIVPFSKKSTNLEIDWIKSFDNLEIEKTNPGTLVKIPYHPEAEPYNLIRKKVLQ